MKRLLWPLLGLAAAFVACQSAASMVPQVKPFLSPSASCLAAKAPSGTQEVARVCDSNTSDRLFVALGTKAEDKLAEAKRIVEGSTALGPNVLHTPLPFSPSGVTFLLIKYRVVAGSKSWDEYGVRVFDGALIVRTITNCPNDIASGPTSSELSCPVAHGNFYTDVASPPQSSTGPGFSNAPTFPLSSSVFLVVPESKTFGTPKVQLSFGYVSRSNSTTLGLATNGASNKVYYIT